MKYLLLLLLVASCTRYQPIAGKYPEPPFQTETKLSFDKTWEKCVDILTERNIPIKIIDKSSGIIVSEKIKLLATAEDVKGGLINKSAYIVVPSFYDPGEKRITTIYPLDFYTGSITVRVKQKEDGALATVNIAEVTADGYMHGKTLSGVVITFKSTGKFEQDFFDRIK